MPLSNISFTTQTNLSYQPNDFVTAIYDANTSIYGRVVSYNPSTGALVITPYSDSGAVGTFSAWDINLSGVHSTSGTAGTSGTSDSSGRSDSSGVSGTSG